MRESMTAEEFKKYVQNIEGFSILNYYSIDSIINKIENEMKVKNKGDNKT